MTIHETAAGRIELPRSGDGRDTLLMLHAAASGPRALFKLASALTAAGSGWQAAMPALNGYGASRLEGVRPDAPLAAHVAIVRWAAGQLGALAAKGDRGRLVIVGHSMGGLIALLAALDGVTADALVLYEPIVLDCLDMTDSVDVAARRWDGACIETLHERFAAGDPEAGVAAFVEAYNEVAWTQLPLALRTELTAKAANLVAETQAAQVLRLDTARFAALPMPVLILQGSRSPPVTQRMTAGLARAIPHARLRIVDGAGHMGPVTSHVAVAEAVAAFLATLAPSAD